MTAKLKTTVKTTVAYFWVPESRRVPMERSPTRVQTVLPHRQFNSLTGEFIRMVDSLDHDVVPVLRCDSIESEPVHNYEVFYEDYVHDWNYHNGELRYASRIREHSTWIRCEFDEHSTCEFDDSSTSIGCEIDE